MDDHRPVFDAQAVLDHAGVSPNAHDPPRPMPAAGALDPDLYRKPEHDEEDDDDDGRSPGSSSSESSADEESIRDMARDLAAVADHCDIAIPVLYSELRRAVASSGPRGASAVGSGSGETPPARVGSYGMAAGSARRRRVGSQSQPQSHAAGERVPLMPSATGTPEAANFTPPQSSSTSSQGRPTPAASAHIPVGANVVHFDPRALDEAESRVTGSTAGSLARSLRSFTSSLTARAHARSSSSSGAAATSGPEALPTRSGGLDAPLAGTEQQFRQSPQARSPTIGAHDEDSMPIVSPNGTINATQSASVPLSDEHASPSERGTDAASVAGTSVSIRGSTVTAAATAGGSGRARVRWAEEIRSVKSYEVDNSVYIAIEYARPFVGWLCLIIAVAAASFDGVIDHYYLASGVTPFASATWEALAQGAIAAILCTVHMAVMGGLSRSEKRYLTTTSGWAQAAIVSGMFALMSVATQSAAHMTRETRPFTFTAVHPLLIAGFGMVFKNTVFYQEIAGISALLIGIGMAMLPADIRANRWWYAEVVALSYGIFAASFLFACTRARARIPIPVLFAALSLLLVGVQLVVAKVQGCTFDMNPSTGIAGFVHRKNIVAFAFTAAFSPLSWVCYLLALRFLPPVTVSAAMVIRPILSCFGVHLAFHVSDDTGPINPTGFDGQATHDGPHEHRTPFWKFLSQEAPPHQGGGQLGGAPGPVLTPAPTPAPIFGPAALNAGNTLPPQLAEIMRQYDANRAAAAHGGEYPSSGSTSPDPVAHVNLFSPLFAVGAFVAVSACIFVIYTSSIKRQKVELLLRALSKRRKPRDPYKRRRAGGHTSVRTFLPDDVPPVAPMLREAENADGTATASSGSSDGMPCTPPTTSAAAGVPLAGGYSPASATDERLLSPVRSPGMLSTRSPHGPVSPMHSASASRLSVSPGRSLGDSATAGSPPTFGARSPPTGRRGNSDLSTSPKWLTPPRASTDDTTVGLPSSGRQTSHAASNTGGSGSDTAAYYDDW